MVLANGYEAMTNNIAIFNPLRRRDSWSNVARSAVVRGLLGLVMFCCLSAPAMAGDYVVAYAIDAYGNHEFGKLENCTYKSVCTTRDNRLEFTIFVIVNGPHDQNASVSMSRPRSGCCLFSDGDDSKQFDVREPVNSFTIFEGRKRKQNEFVRNRMIGTLYIAFSNSQ